LTLCELSPGRFAHASGALWLPADQTIVIADAHLGYGWAQRRRGELGPVSDRKSRPKIQALLDELHPARIVFLGDLVHAPRPAVEERTHIESLLGELAAAAELILVRGNHDRAFAYDFGHLGLTLVPEWRSRGLTALHGDRLDRSAIPEAGLIVGHLHPVVKIKDAAGASTKLPLFLVSERITVLPAFSPYSAGCDVSKALPPELRDVIGKAPVEGVAVTGKRALKIGPIPLRGRRPQ
jgi:putative SbcD/Mre11-related phosphoesterase